MELDKKSIMGGKNVRGYEEGFLIKWGAKVIKPGCMSIE